MATFTYCEQLKHPSLDGNRACLVAARPQWGSWSRSQIASHANFITAMLLVNFGTN